QIWRFLWFLAEKRPLLGVGYGALWQTGPQVESLVEYTGATWVPNEGHNGYLDILAQVGLVGIACLLVFLTVSFNRLTRYMRIPGKEASAGYKEYALYVFFGVLIYNITESSLFRPGQEVWFMLVYLTTSASLALRRNSLGRDATP
ncbi:MAG: O-antigen ligase family protein, partial [Acidobacteriaceae bacterium]|nr:O-antigen ligase family protein [Acidobacteriaceae bacterium]